MQEFDNTNQDKSFGNEYFIDTSKKRRASTTSLANEFGSLPNINESSQQEHDGVFSKNIKIRFIAGFVEAISKIPTFFPKNFFQQFKLWFLPDKNRLYIYDYVNRRWVWVQANIDEYETTQINLPDTSNGGTDAFSNGWYRVEDSEAATFANGGELFSVVGTQYSWINKLIGFAGVLDFDNPKKVRIEYTGLPDSVGADAKNAFGFIDPNTPGGEPLDPPDAVDIDAVDRRICFATDGTTLYAVCADGTGNTNQVVPGVTLSTTVALRMKILWNPAEGNVQFFINDELKNTITTNVPNTPGISGLWIFFAGTDGGNGMGMTFTYPKVGLQIN